MHQSSNLIGFKTWRGALLPWLLLALLCPVGASAHEDEKGVLEEVVVKGEPHPLTGNIVVARVRLSSDESLAEFRKRMRKFCSSRLARFKIPQKVELADNSLHGERFKKMRR